MTDPATESSRRRPVVEIDERLIARTIELHVGRAPIALTPQATKPPRFVYEARFDGMPAVYFKGEHPTGEDDAIVLECWAMDAARHAGTPTPEVVALDTSCTIFPGRFAIFEAARGIAVSMFPREDPRLADVQRAAGGAIRRAHGVAVDAFGRLDDNEYLATGEVRGKHATWRSYAFDRPIAAIETLTAAAILDAQTAAAFERRLRDDTVIFDVMQARLVHGDFDETHIFADPASGELTSIIDWGDREACDPAWDLAVLLLWDGREVLNGVLAGYGEDTAEREALLERIDVYVVAFALRLADWYRDEGYVRRAREAIAGALRMLHDRA